jgi:plastocyanin domain-containing protein
MDIYGVLNYEGVHIDVSKSEKGAKNYATRNGYKTVTIRFNCGYNAMQIAEKKGKKCENL